MTLAIAKTKDRVACRVFREFVCSLICAACGRRGPCDPAHVVSRKRADGSDLGCIPLCRFPCHRTFDDAGKGREAWFKSVTGSTVADVQFMVQARFRKLYGLPEDGDFEQVVRDAGLIEAPFTRRKNRKSK